MTDKVLTWSAQYKNSNIGSVFLFFKLMTKIAILKKRIIRAYNNPENWKYSEYKGYPEGTYFGYDSLNDLLNSTIRDYQSYYGKGLKKWRYI